MKPNQLLTRLRQDLRKIREAETEIGRERYLRFAKGKIVTLAAVYRQGKMERCDIESFAAAVDEYQNLTNIK